MFQVLHFDIADYISPQQVASYIAQGVTLIVAVFALINVYVSKKTRTPADNQAREDFAYKLLKERLDEANSDREVLTKTINYLRDDASKRDIKDREDWQLEQDRVDVIRSLQQRIGEQDQKIRKLESQRDMIAEKVRKGYPITLADVYGEDFETMGPDGLGDVELTQVKIKEH